MMRKPKIRWGAVLSAAVTVASALAPVVIPAVTAKHAILGVLLGAVCQASTNRVTRREGER